MSAKRPVLLIVAAALLGVGWYFFRPERAVLDRRIAESAPSQSAAIIVSGDFESRAHESRGMAQVLDVGDGRRVLRFVDFETSDGPDLQVYLIASPNAATTGELEAAGFVSLGALKGNVGAQNYEIPADVDLSRFPAVSVWCRRFGVNFATATLAAVARGA